MIEKMISEIKKGRNHLRPFLREIISFYVLPGRNRFAFSEIACLNFVEIGGESFFQLSKLPKGFLHGVKKGSQRWFE